MYQAIAFLMIDDHPGDIRLAQQCFSTHRVSNALWVVHDCEEALHFLRCQGDYVQAPAPDILLISFCLLRDQADHLVQCIKAETTRRHIPIVALTDLDQETLLWDGDLPISLCIPKPLTLAGLITIVTHTDHLGFTLARRPTPFPVPV